MESVLDWVTNMARILIVDDHEETVRELEHVLKQRGHTPISTISYIDGKKILENEKDPVDIAIIDVRLVDTPLDRSGLDLASIAPLVPKVIVTGYPTVQVARESLRSNDGEPLALDFIPKGVGATAKILSSIDSILAKSLSVDPQRTRPSNRLNIIKWLLLIIIIILFYPMIVAFNSDSIDLAYVILTIILTVIALILQIISTQSK